MTRSRIFARSDLRAEDVEEREAIRRLATVFARVPGSLDKGENPFLESVLRMNDNPVKTVATPVGPVEVPASKHEPSSRERAYRKEYLERGKPCSLTVTVHYDDRCRNGHNTLTVTGDLRVDGRWESGGCLHDLIAKHFPELKPAIEYHLVSTDGPMHYFANTTYLAGDRDHWGWRKDEHTRSRDGKLIWQARQDWSRFYGDAPPEEGKTYVPVLGEGKARELDAARRAAVWPDATDAELCQDKPALEKALAERLPALMQRFKAVVEALGFPY